MPRLSLRDSAVDNNSAKQRVAYGEKLDTRAQNFPILLNLFKDLDGALKAPWLSIKTIGFRPVELSRVKTRGLGHGKLCLLKNRDRSFSSMSHILWDIIIQSKSDEK